jgi:hypothetical protein
MGTLDGEILLFEVRGNLSSTLGWVHAVVHERVSSC